MEFYFCEKCGKRVTAVDVAQGQAKNKKLRGVFCTECAEGVLTLETMALTDDAARAILDKSPTPSKPSATVGASSSKAIRPAKARATPAKPERSKASVFAAAGAGLLVFVLLLALVFGRSSTPAQEHAKAPAPALSVLDRTSPPAAPEPPAPKTLPTVTEREPARVAEPAVEPAVPAPVEPPVQAAVETPVPPTTQPKQVVEVKTEEPSGPELTQTPVPAEATKSPPLPAPSEAPAEGTFAKSASPDEPRASKSAPPTEAKTVEPPASARYEDPSLREGLVFQQSFEDVVSSKSATTGPESSDSGVHGKAFRFNGQGHDSGGIILQGPHLKNIEQVSIALWIKRAAHASDLTILENRHRYRLSLQATQVTWQWIQGEDNYLLPAPLPVRAAETGWIHVAWTCDGKVSLAYVNGRQVSQRQAGNGAIGRPQNSGYSLRIGGKFVTGSEKNAPTFNGWMDELRVYHRVLDPKEVAALAKAP
ncbi:MAG: hypothetical protein HS116_01795 [Planctomycetes bacterium]|nr:hypothetical protein [Planctomycetota bacterium]